MAERIIAGIGWLAVTFLLACCVGKFIEAGMYDEREDKDK